MYQVLLKINEVLIVICKTPSKAYFPKCLIYVNYMRLHRDSLRSRSVVNALKHILGACGSLSDQLFGANTFRRICKIPLSTTAKSYSHTYSPALEPCGHHWDHNFLFAVTLHRWLHLVAQVYLKVHAVTYVIYYI